MTVFESLHLLYRTIYSRLFLYIKCQDLTIEKYKTNMPWSIIYVVCLKDIFLMSLPIAYYLSCPLIFMRLYCATYFLSSEEAE